MKRILNTLVFIMSATLLNAQTISETTPDSLIIRIAEIEIYPEYLDDYLAAAKTVGAESVAKEPGVIGIYPMIQRRDKCQIRILEIYRDQDAYQSHLQTSHFLAYKQGTLHMVKSLDLVDMSPMNAEGMAAIFAKMKNDKYMEFKEIISERYSCRKFSDEKISREQLNAILEAGRLAPTAKNLQEQHIYVLESPEALTKIDEVTRCRYGAQTCLVVAFDKTNVFTYPGGKRDSGIEDAAIVATHLMLAAKAVGVESCWLNAFDPDILAQLLGLPANEEILMILDLGYAAEDAAPSPNHSSRKPLEDTVTYL